MTSRYGWVLALMLIGAGPAQAQETGPWKVVVSSTANPLRVAECSPVRIDVTDAKGNARNPKGVLISLADFDLSVSAGTGGAIVGRYDGAAAWSACACPGAAGATATITATYPARSLPAELRMPGVTFQSSINVPVIPGRSSAIPIGCEVVKTTTTGGGAPWAVTIVPSVRAIPIGTCAPIYIDLRDPIIKSSPRNPKGILLSLADFDMSVAAASGAVAGRADGAGAWSVCGCQGAAVGTTATITATYPARALADGLRVPGVAFQSSTTITLAAPNGTFNPPACVSPQPGAIAPASSRVLTPPAPAAAPASGAAAGGAASTAAGNAAGAAAGGAAGGSVAGRADGAGTAVGGTAAGTAAGKTGGAGAAGGGAAGAAAAGSAKTEAGGNGAVATAGGGAASAAAGGAGGAGAAAGAGAKGEATTATGTAAGEAVGAATKGGAAAGGAVGGGAGAAAAAKIEAGAGGAVAGAAGSAGAAASGAAGAAGAGAAGAARGGAAAGSTTTGRAATTGPVALPTGGAPVTRAPIGTSLYAPGPATASFPLSGRGSWYEAGPMNVNLGPLTGRGSWYEPGPVTVTFGLSGTGSWVERTPPGGTLQPAQPRP